jgi:hypothetical protein
MTDQERLKLSILHLVVQHRYALEVHEIAPACETLHAWVTKESLALPKIEEPIDASLIQAKCQAVAADWGMANPDFEFAREVATRVLLARGNQNG